MTPAIQETLLQLFDHVRQDPDTVPTVPIDDWQEGSMEWRLLAGFQDRKCFRDNAVRFPFAIQGQ